MAEARFSPLGLRLAAAFVPVAVLAVGVYAVLTVASTREQLAELILQVHGQDAEAAAAAAARAYEEVGSWEEADLLGAVAVAARGQATIAVRDANGNLVAAPAEEAAAMLEEMHGVEIVDLPRGDPVVAPVVVDGEKVGSLVLRFPASHLPAPEQQIRSGLLRTALVGATAAVLVAIGVALFVARRVSRPLVASPMRRRRWRGRRGFGRRIAGQLGASPRSTGCRIGRATGGGGASCPRRRAQSALRSRSCAGRPRSGRRRPEPDHETLCRPRRGAAADGLVGDLETLPR
jgi:hypothetical protein